MQTVFMSAAETVISRSLEYCFYISVNVHTMMWCFNKKHPSFTRKSVIDAWILLHHTFTLMY